MSYRDDGIQNAIIRSTQLGCIDGPGIFTWAIVLDYGGATQSYMGPCMDEPVYDKNEPPRWGGDKGEYLGRRGTAFGHECIRRLMEVLGCSNWEDLKGKPVRVKKEGGIVRAMGNYLDDKWFDAREVAKELGIS